MSDTDLLLVGGGLANILIALRLAETHPEIKLLILEQGQTVGGNHTWSYHGGDLSTAQLDWLRPLNTYNWNNYSVRFPGYTRTLPGSYHSLTSDQLNTTAKTKLGAAVRTGTTVSKLHENYVTLDDGTRITARAVIDGRGPAASPHLDVRFQKFVGWEVQLDEPHGLSGPIIMDATIDQDDGYRFFYCLPFTDDTLLIEDTHYSDGPELATVDYGDEIERYAAQQGWRIKKCLRTEDGVLPITLGGNIEAFWNNGAAVARSGLRAALFHPATGYSLPNAVAMAWLLSDALTASDNWSAKTVYDSTRHCSETLWRRTSFYRVLNRMLFLAAAPPARRKIMQRFYGLNAGLIARFYAGQNTLIDKARILAGKPPVALRPAFKSVFRYKAANNLPPAL